MAKDRKEGPIKTKLFFSHTHLDHIIGFPFFVPIFLPDTEIELYGPVSFEEDSLAKVIGGQMQYRYFPVSMEELAAKISYHHLKETTLDLGNGIKVKTKFLNHPITCLGYRFEHQGKVIVTLFDHEPFQNVFAHGGEDMDESLVEEGRIVADQENQKILDFIQGADVVIHDAQYTEKEYHEGKIGWGHSSMERAIDNGIKAGVKELVLIHHEPTRSDAQLKNLEESLQKQFQKEGSFKLCFAREGMVF